MRSAARSGVSEAEPSLSEVCRTPQRGVAFAAEVDRRMRRLNRFAILPTGSKRVVLVIPARHGVAPQTLQNTDVGTRSLAPTFERDVQRGELFGEPTGADAEVETPARQIVESGGLFGGVERVALREEAHRRAYTDACCRGSEEGKEIERFEDRALPWASKLAVRRVGVRRLVLVEQHDVFWRPDRVEAGRLCIAGGVAEEHGRCIRK